MIKALILT